MVDPLENEQFELRTGNKMGPRISPAAKPRFGALPCFEVLSFFLMDSVSLGIADDQTESWNFVSVEQFKI